MTNLINVGRAMTSLQIAEVTGKRHSNVLRAIRSMESAWERIHGRKFEYKLKITEIGNGALRETPYYELTKTECLYIATKFNDEARARLILRWEELENERLDALRQPAEAKAEEQPSPAADSRPVTSGLVEIVEGKEVTTSRILAEMLGRKHDSVLGTIKSHLHERAFKYGNFVRRTYSNPGTSHGYEFLITRKGLEVLAAIMRYSYREKIAEAYVNVWGKASPKCLPAQKCLPLQTEEPAGDNSDADAALIPAPDQPEQTGGLEEEIKNLRTRLQDARDTMKQYADMYAEEKAKRRRQSDSMAYWHDLYEDLMLKLEVCDEKPAAKILKDHMAFRRRLHVKYS